MDGPFEADVSIAAKAFTPLLLAAFRARPMIAPENEFGFYCNVPPMQLLYCKVPPM